MQFLEIEQRTEEWFKLKAGKISGTRFGAAISSRKNGLIYELISEKIDGFIDPIDYESEAMKYGNENEEHAIDLYEIESGMKFIRGGVILSDYSAIHMSSPDAHNADDPHHVIIVEAKCTLNGDKQVKRFFEGVDPEYMGQIKNYFAVSDDVQEVHFISYCGTRPERELVVKIVKREDVIDDVLKGRIAVKKIETELDRMYDEFLPQTMKF